MIPLSQTIIQADWDAPDNIRTLVTTRMGGYSLPPYKSFNLAMHVGDDPQIVEQNRKRLEELLPSEPKWLNQIHSSRIINAADIEPQPDADGSITAQKNIVSVVMTADCLPALICNRQGSAVAAVHAGWRGLLAGILEQGAEQLLKLSTCQKDEVLVWLGPAIGPNHFEVGDDVRQAFLARAQGRGQSHYESIERCFAKHTKTSDGQNKYLADIYQLARVRLSAIGVDNVSGGHYCTYSEADKFYSYRRDGVTGRMASMVWINQAEMQPELIKQQREQ